MLAEKAAEDSSLWRIPGPLQWKAETHRLERQGVQPPAIQAILRTKLAGSLDEALVDTQGGAPQPAEAPITTCNAINELPEEPFMTSIERPTEAHKATSIAPTDSSSRCASEPTEGLCPLGSCMGIQLSSLTDSDFLGLASAVQDEDQRRLRRDVRWDPLGLPRFLPPKRQKTQTSGEDQRVARTGSRRGASQLAPTASPTVVERPEEDHQHAHVSLLGALHGERYGFPGGGEAPEFLVPAGKFLAEHILGKRLVKLIWTQEGWAPLQDEATGEPVLSPAPASAFVGGDNRLYVSGSLARIANEHGMVFVMFSDQQARGVTRTAWCDDVLWEHAEEHSRDPLKLARFLKKRARGTGASDENTPVTTPASKCQRRCLNMPALPHTFTAPPTPMPGVDSPFLCRCLIWGRTSWKGSVNLCWGPLKVNVMSSFNFSRVL